MTQTKLNMAASSKKLVSLCKALLHSTSRIEDNWWEGKIHQELQNILQDAPNHKIENALTFLMQNHPEIYELLCEQAENNTESIEIEHNGMLYEALMFSAPILVWTRYQLPNGNIDSKLQTKIKNNFKKIIAATNAKVSIVPGILNFDLMPQNFYETYEWTKQLALAALEGKKSPIQMQAHPDSYGILADSHFIVGVIVVPKGKPLFKWQQTQTNNIGLREQIEMDWVKACKQTLDNIYTGCSTQFLCPQAFFTGNRDGDKHIRPFVLRAAVTWLQTAAEIQLSNLKATIVACGEDVVEEYRIGFSTKDDDTVIYGCLWPILSKEESITELIDDSLPTISDIISAILTEENVNEIRRIPGLKHCDYCEDCGAPYFPDKLGELQHPELPDETNLEPIQLH